jgi:hypothetical protein
MKQDTATGTGRIAGSDRFVMKRIIMVSCPSIPHDEFQVRAFVSLATDYKGTYSFIGFKKGYAP